MDRLRELETLVAVAEEESFARAARALGASPPAVTRVIAALESRLGVQLFTRTTRSVQLTEAGTRFLERTRQILSDIGTAEQEVAGLTETPKGRLRITSSVTFGRLAIAPLLSGFMEAYPDITPSVIMADRIVNLVDEGIDIAVRIGHLPDSSLIARKVGEVRKLLVASPDYLAKAGNPTRPADLRDHKIIRFTSLMPTNRWHYMEGGKPGQVSVYPQAEINDATAAITLAEHGAGMTLVLSYMVRDQIRNGTLQSVLDHYGVDPLPVHLVYPENRIVTPKVRAFMDYATERLPSRLDCPPA